MSKLADMVTTDNVVMMETFRVLRKLKDEQYLPYKARYEAMDEGARHSERLRVQAMKQLNPENVIARLMERAQAEVDNG